MIDGIMIQNGKPIVVSADDWTEIESQFKKAGIQFWGWQRFDSDDGGDCVGVNVPAGDWERAQEIAEMDGAADPYGWLIRSLVALILLALVMLVLLGGANF